MAVRYELEKLESVVSDDLSDFVRMNYPVDDRLMVRFSDRVREEIESIKINFSRSVLYFEDERSQELYIRFHQRAVIELTGYLTKYLQAEPVNDTIPQELNNGKLSDELYLSLQELLSFLAHQFPRYFDFDAWIPENYRRVMFHDIERNFIEIQGCLLKTISDSELTDLTLLPFKEFLQTKYSNQSTYRKVLFLQVLQRDLYAFCHHRYEGAEKADEQLQWILFGLNYNTLEFYQYCIRKLTTLIASIEDLTEKLNCLFLFNKQLFQQPPREQISYDNGRKSVKHALMDWIDREIDYLEMQQNSMSGSTVEEPCHDRIAKFKVRVELSVAQLAYFLRILTESNVIVDPNVNLLMRYVTKIFQTKRSQNLGHGSFHGRYYNVEDSTRQSVREVLLRMIRYIDSDEGRP